MEEDRGAFKIVTGKTIGNRLLGRHTCRWEDNISIDVAIVEQFEK